MLPELLQPLIASVKLQPKRKLDNKESITMGNLLTILVILFVSLFVLVTLLEKFGNKTEEQDLSKLTRWVYPLMAIMLGAYLVKYFFMS
jgi:cadmium resistance protein CadD (predicted permease)